MTLKHENKPIRTVSMLIRLTPIEKRAYRAHARSVGRSVVNWVRWVLKDEIQAKTGLKPALEHALTHSLDRPGEKGVNND